MRLAPPAVNPADLPDPADLPAAAQKLVEDHRREAAEVRKQAEDRVKTQRAELIDALRKLMAEYTKAGQLDEALAVRECVRALKGMQHDARPGPVNLSAYRDQVGKAFFFLVTGSRAGVVWGTDLYTDDSDLATAAVHAGVLKGGESGVVKVTVLKGEENFLGSQRHGVTSMMYGAFPGSYRVEGVKE
jgi:hypothetical protein